MYLCFASAGASVPSSLRSASFTGALPCLSRGKHRRQIIPRTPARVKALVAPSGPTSDATNDALLHASMFAAGPLLNVFTVVMVIRIVLTWYPKTDLRKAPWIFLAVPTEPLLAATRKVIKPVGGVDISPIVWTAIATFVHEILVGPQGLLVLLSKK
jgi:YggT family protein